MTNELTMENIIVLLNQGRFTENILSTDNDTNRLNYLDAIQESYDASLEFEYSMNVLDLHMGIRKEVDKLQSVNNEDAVDAVFTGCVLALLIIPAIVSFIKWIITASTRSKYQIDIVRDIVYKHRDKLTNEKISACTAIVPKYRNVKMDYLAILDDIGVGIGNVDKLKKFIVSLIDVAIKKDSKQNSAEWARSVKILQSEISTIIIGDIPIVKIDKYSELLKISVDSATKIEYNIPDPTGANFTKYNETALISNKIGSQIFRAIASKYFVISDLKVVTKTPVNESKVTMEAIDKFILTYGDLWTEFKSLSDTVRDKQNLLYGFKDEPVNIEIYKMIKLGLYLTYDVIDSLATVIWILCTNIIEVIDVLKKQ